MSKTKTKFPPPAPELAALIDQYVGEGKPFPTAKAMAQCAGVNYTTLWRALNRGSTLRPRTMKDLENAAGDLGAALTGDVQTVQAKEVQP